MGVSNPGPDGKLVAEDDATTRAKILAWAAFTYEVATGRIKESDDYCTAFAGSAPAISAAMVPKGFPWCAGGRKRWTVGTLFSWRCGKFLIVFGYCNRLGGPDFTKNVAKGALLHLVEDSYSQSHIIRTDAPLLNDAGVARAVVECGKPRRFLSYTKEAMRGHSVADEAPVWGESCQGSSETDDVIAAAANTLAYIEEDAATTDFIAYLGKHVF
jgi:hypothetical protein